MTNNTCSKVTVSSLYPVVYIRSSRNSVLILLVAIEKKEIGTR